RPGRARLRAAGRATLPRLSGPALPGLARLSGLLLPMLGPLLPARVLAALRVSRLLARLLGRVLSVLLVRGRRLGPTGLRAVLRLPALLLGGTAVRTEAAVHRALRLSALTETQTAPRAASRTGTRAAHRGGVRQVRREGSHVPGRCCARRHRSLRDPRTRTGSSGKCAEPRATRGRGPPGSGTCGSPDP